MVKTVFTVEFNKRIAKDTWSMALSGFTAGIKRPGQFVNIALDGLYLRRPISVCDWEDGNLLLIYKTVGKGTEQMSRLGRGAQLELLTGLGNGYDTSKAGQRNLLIGGGAGIPPLYALGRKLIEEGKPVAALFGFNSREEVFGVKMFKELGMQVLVATVDGSYGEKGFVTDLLPRAVGCDYCYVCGPAPMLRAVYDATSCGGQYSFEERMGCGFGACMGCSIETKNGPKRICKDGPILEKEEILWQN